MKKKPVNLKPPKKLQKCPTARQALRSHKTKTKGKSKSRGIKMLNGGKGVSKIREFLATKTIEIRASTRDLSISKDTDTFNDTGNVYGSRQQSPKPRNTKKTAPLTARVSTKKPKNNRKPKKLKNKKLELDLS